MIVKEWWGTRKVLIASLAATVPILLIAAYYLPPYESAGRVGGVFPENVAIGQIMNVYSGGGIALGLLAALLGAALISGEASRGTISLLLSKPVSRTRILMTKYAVCASILFLAALLGNVLLLIVAAAKGYPLFGLLSVSDVALSTVLLWLGSLSVLGAALVFSVIFSDINISIVAAALVFFAYWFLVTIGVSYWSSEDLYTGGGSAVTNLVVCLIAAGVPLLAALWLFNRKAY